MNKTVTFTFSHFHVPKNALAKQVDSASGIPTLECKFSNIIGFESPLKKGLGIMIGILSPQCEEFVSSDSRKFVLYTQRNFEACRTHNLKPLERDQQCYDL